jgi:hypothetical protein
MITLWCWLWYVRCLGDADGGDANARQIFSIGTTVLVILASQIYGWDRHVWDLRPSMMEQGRQVSVTHRITIS